MQIFRQKFLNNIFNLYLADPESIPDREAARKILLMLSIAGTGVFCLLVMGSIAWLRHQFVLSAVDYVVALILIALLLDLRKSRKYVFCCYAGVALMSLLYWYLFVSGAGSRTAFLWLYTYPLFALFLLGSRHGAMAILFFFVPCLGFLFVDLVSGGDQLYELDFVLRFIPSFLTVSLFAFMFEKSNEEARKFLMDAHLVLEQQVLERTRDLQHEINARIQNEEKLQISEQRYRTLFDSNGDAVSIISATGRFLEVNKELCQRLGYSHAELLAMKAQDINSPVSTGLVSRYLQELFAKSQESVVLEVEHVRRDGGIIPVELRAKRILFNNEEAVLAVCQDIRDRKKAEKEKKTLEEQLHRAQKMEAIGLMAGGVAHDLNNILSGVIAYPDMLLRQLPENHDLCAQLNIIKQSGKRAAAVVADLLTVARGVAHQKETASLNVLVDQFFCSPELQALTSQYSQIKYATDLASDLMNIECSVVHINKCLMNLVFNAMEAIHGPGMVTVTTRNKDIDAEYAQSLHLAPGQYVVMVVSDTGTGIQDSDLQQIFEPFYTKKKMGRSGTGLGLAIVWNSMQDHKGTVTVESSSKGSSFTLYFPVSKRMISEIGLKVDLELMQGKGESVLVVDDEPMQRDIAVKMLSLLGYSPLEAASGEEALAFLEKNTVDLILLDMLMEPGMNGYQTYAEVVKKHPGQKAVIASGYSESEDILKAYQLGVEGFIKKPYTINQLGQKVYKALHT